MYRAFVFFASGLVSFLLVGTVVAQQLASGSLEVRPVIDGRLKTASLHHMTGTVKEVDLVGHTMSLKSRHGDQSFVITPDTQLKRGRQHLRLDGLRLESEVTVSYLERDGKRLANIIKVKE
ncbi:MAG: hypothetical protein HY283_05100 [Nitrospirae bacterium]|nr:hypothetical protein [Nitrospirota bacterium]